MASQAKKAANETFASSDVETPQKIRVKGGGYATLLFLAGLGLVVGGAGMATADHFSWQVVKFRQMVTPYGVQGASLAMIGIVVMCASFVARAAVKASASAATSAAGKDVGKDIAMLADQVAGNMGGIKRSISRLSEGVSSVITAQNQLLQQMAQLATDEADSGQQDGLFRLAASLDKLGAQMDERLQGIGAEIGGRLDGVSQTLATMEAQGLSAGVNTGVDAGAFSNEPAAPPAPSGLPHGELGSSQEELDVLVELERELLEGKEPNLEFFDAVEDLDGEIEEVTESPKIELDVEEPRGPLTSPPRQPLDVLMPEDE